MKTIIADEIEKIVLEAWPLLNENGPKDRLIITDHNRMATG